MPFCIFIEGQNNVIQSRFLVDPYTLSIVIDAMYKVLKQLTFLSYYVLLIWLVVSTTVSADQSQLRSASIIERTPEQFGLEHLMETLNLKPSDIGYRTDYTEPDSFRLQLISDLMTTPLGMIDYASQLRQSVVRGQPEVMSAYLFKDLAGAGKSKRGKAYSPNEQELTRPVNLFYSDPILNRLLSRVSLYLDIIIPKSTELAFADISTSQRQFLTTKFVHLLELRVEDEFLTPNQLDSVEKLDEEYAETFAEFGYRINSDPIVDAGLDCLKKLMLDVNALRSQIDSRQVSAKHLVNNTVTLPPGVDRSSYLGVQNGWAVGGPGNDYYRGDYWFILDLGGDDHYDLTYDSHNPHPVIIIDLSGNDLYQTKTDFAIASGCMTVSMLLDFEGDDSYRGQRFSLGSGYFGFGLLYDKSGNDHYDGDTHVQGAGTYGLGLLIDESGRDIYNAAAYAQGFGYVRGFGMIIEGDGADSYYAGGKYKDFLRYDQHYLSMSQGFGFGSRPILSGGIGIILDRKGNDNYYSDIFAQGASYWWSLGMIYDSDGNDNYQSFQYAQGAATHMTLGALIDDFGDDVYTGKGLMQGVGHDYSCGLILDRHGNDLYTAYDLSQGAGSANGAGLLIDNEGDDRYYVKIKKNTHGYGNPRRDFGSIGLFIDLGGFDQYTGFGQNNYYWQTDSKWGGGMDIERMDPDSAKTGGR